ncbi:MAG TPA: fused MFS/spermidine synthase [Polyangiaceae bacterium]|nr:fused MFS/spermidine synthase [Polyangiaceae bacterium]
MNTWSTAEVLPALRREPREVLAVGFALTIFTSAFLLFQIEPLISKVILPWFGGSPAVWTTCLLFFQVLLFLGYAYAHLTTRFLSRSRQTWLHLGLVVCAALLLPPVPGAHARPTAGDDPTLGVFLLLLRSVGLPYFVLSSTGPLVQGWFGQAFPGRAPYRLYALSNLGSLLALVSYPFVVEPAFTTQTQAREWSSGFVLFTLLVGALASGRLRAPPESSPSAAFAPPSAAASPAPTWRRRAVWVGLPAFASAFLLATTNHVCEDVAVIPFLWVVPLALYLLSFIVAFDGPRWYARRTFALSGGLLALAAGCIDPLDELCSALGHGLGFKELVVLDFALLFVTSMLCHGELVRTKPRSERLTEFYLWVAFGGALGGLAVSIVCPAVFSTFLEWPLGLLGSFVLALGVWWSAAESAGWRGRYGLVAKTLVFSLGIVAIAHGQADDDPPLAISRNFYGTVAVYDVDANDPAQRHYSLLHGAIVHGRQFRAPEKQDQPLSYYGDVSGVGRTLSYFGALPELRVGAVGLGVGTLAHYVHAGQHLRFYEINPEVVRLARTHFTYLARCGAACDVVLGDARLSLERESPQHFDVLVLDAFSGDAVPAHLLTREALDVYTRHLEPDGVIAVNITNRMLDLAPVLEGLAREAHLKAVRVYSDDDAARELYHADWMLLTRNARFLAAVPPRLPPELPSPKLAVLWTDNHSNLFELLK